MVRLQRKLSKETKDKISKALKGKKKTDEHKEKISSKMKQYWEGIPYENNKINTDNNVKEVN